MDIITERLRLTPVELTHVQDIFDNFNEQVTRYMIPTQASDISETYAVVSEFIRQREQGTDFVYAILLNSTSGFIGLTGLHYANTDLPHLGIWTKAEAHGHHYGREAIGGVIKYAKSIGITKLCYPVDGRNVASKKIPLFYGGKQVSANEIYNTQDGRILQIERYEIEVG